MILKLTGLNAAEHFTVRSHLWRWSLKDSVQAFVPVYQ